MRRKQTFVFFLLSVLHPSFSEEWKKYPGLDCYANQGAEVIFPEPFNAQLTLEQCQDTCLEEQGCEGIIRKEDQGEGSGLCYLRKSINRILCGRDSRWDLYEVSSSKVKYLRRLKYIFIFYRIYFNNKAALNIYQTNIKTTNKEAG